MTVNHRNQATSPELIFLFHVEVCTDLVRYRSVPGILIPGNDSIADQACLSRLSAIYYWSKARNKDSLICTKTSMSQSKHACNSRSIRKFMNAHRTLRQEFHLMGIACFDLYDCTRLDTSVHVAGSKAQSSQPKNGVLTMQRASTFQSGHAHIE